MKQKAKPKVNITPAKVKTVASPSSSAKAATPTSVPLSVEETMEEVAVDPLDDVPSEEVPGPSTMPSNLQDAITDMLQHCESDEVMILGLQYYLVLAIT